MEVRTSTLPPHVEGTIAAIAELHASHYTVHVGRNAAVARPATLAVVTAAVVG